jgi:outer membrane protein
MRALTLWLALGGPARAASLDDFLASAARTNPDIAAAEARFDAARAGVDVARSNLLPSLSTTGSATVNIPEVKATLPVGEQPIEIVIQRADQLDLRTQATLPLFAPGAVAATTAAARQRDAGAAASDRASEATLLAVVQAYFTAVASDRVEQAAREGHTAADASLAVARARYDLDAASVLDLRRAEAEVARTRQALVQAEVDHRSARRRLATLSGLEEAPDADNAPRPTPDGDLVARVDVGNPDLVAAEAQVAAARAQVAASNWQYAPNIAGFAQWNATNATGFSGRVHTGAVGVRAQWNLVDGGAREGRAAQARASLREAEFRLESARRTVHDELAAAIDVAQAAEVQVEAAEAGRVAAREAGRLAEEQFRLGAIDAQTLAIARRDAFGAEVQAASAALARAVAVERLRFLVGDPIGG